MLLFRRLWVFFFSVLGSYLCTNHSISTRTYVTCQPFTINMYQHVPTCQPFNINIFWNKPKNGCPGCRDPANYFGFSGKDLAENAETIRFALCVGWSLSHKNCIFWKPDSANFLDVCLTIIYDVWIPVAKLLLELCPDGGAETLGLLFGWRAWWRWGCSLCIVLPLSNSVQLIP